MKFNVLGVCRIARDSAKVEDQVRLLAGTLTFVPQMEGGNTMRRDDNTFDYGTRVVGGLGAFLAAILGGLARHADDVGRGVLRHADDFGRVGIHQVDDFSRPAFQSADDLLRRLEVDRAGRLQITDTGDDISRALIIENHVDDVAHESDTVFDAFAHRAGHEALRTAVRIAGDREDDLEQ